MPLGFSVQIVLLFVRLRLHALAHPMHNKIFRHLILLQSTVTSKSFATLIVIFFVALLGQGGELWTWSVIGINNPSTKLTCSLQESAINS